MVLDIKYRFFFYGLHGYFDEIVFTSLHDFFLEKADWRFPGHSSLYAFFIYGIASLVVEHFYLRYLKGKSLLLRSIIWTLFGFSWEYAAGFILRQFDACPWDYSHKPWNLHGLITLDYGPLWLCLSLYQEKITDFFLNVNVGHCGSCLKTKAS